ncbi:MAG: SAM-dependent chlorinase/fluorinase, partial [Gemmatimonadaceae bacterium]
MIIGPYWRSGRAFVALLVAAVAALVLGLLMPRQAHAQPRPSSFTFVYLVGADTVATETVTPGDGVVKGVIADLAPHAKVIDLTHEIPPFDVRAGSLALARCIS